MKRSRISSLAAAGLQVTALSDQPGQGRDQRFVRGVDADDLQAERALVAGSEREADRAGADAVEAEPLAQQARGAGNIVQCMAHARLVAIVDAARDRLESSPHAAGSRPSYAGPGQDGFAEYLWFTVHGRYPTSAELAGFESNAGSNLWSAVGSQIDDGSTAASIENGSGSMSGL